MIALEVDCTEFVVAVLTAGMPQARVCTELPDKLLAAVPVIQVFRVGGPNDAVILDVPTMTLHAFTAAKPSGQQAANQLLHAAYTTLRLAVGRVVAVTGGNAVMSRVRLLSGCAWAGYENPDVRHAVSTIQPRIKATH